MSLPGLSHRFEKLTIPSAAASAPKPQPHRHRFQREDRLPLSEIESVEISLYTTEEIDRLAVVNVTSSEREGPNTVRDLKMGPHNENMVCETCARDIHECPGHFGKIILPRLMHPLVVNSIIHVLGCVCNSCSALLVTREQLEKEGITSMRGFKRLQEIKQLVARLKPKCNRYANDPKVKPCEANPTYLGVRENKDSYKLAYRYGTKGAISYLPPGLPDDEDGRCVYNILDNISDEDAALLGFVTTHPRNMVIDRLLVVPYCARPDMYPDNGVIQSDDLTTLYMEIVKAVKKYNAETDEAKKDERLKELYFKVSHILKNDGKYSQSSGKVFTDIKKRIQGKNAIVRSNIMGKRVNFAGRTVAGPGYYLRVDEVGIPRLMAAKLTRPIMVTAMNLAELQAKYDAGKVKHIIKASGKGAGSRMPVTAAFQRTNYKLQIGDIVERELEDGDLVLINRQPTLHKQNILGLYARIIDDRVVRINLSVTTPLNADFDGDEINVHVPQTLEAYVEAEQILGVYNNLMDGQKNKPMIGIVFDTLVGAYLLSYPEEEYDKVVAKLAKDPDDPVLLDQKERLRHKILLDKDMYETSLDRIRDAPQLQTLSARLDKYGINKYSGRALLSACFPEDFDYSAHGVVIKEGVLLKGVLSKATLGREDGSIISEMYKQLGGYVTVDFMSDIQFVVGQYLQLRGFSVGMDDCIPEDPHFREKLLQEGDAAITKVVHLLAEKPADAFAAERQEKKVLQTLENFKNTGDNIVQKYHKPDSAILVMARSGAKGTQYNAIQISAALGQVKVSGRRIQANLPGERSLPVYEPGEKDPKSRGFCTNSFSTGLEPTEFFFHVQGGREGLTDTAVNTADTGSLQHQLIKSAEDIHISADGSVRSADNTIVQFVYGDDGFDASHLGSVKILGENVPFFRNIQQLADKINRKYA